jgi:hypothetical protein
VGVVGGGTLLAEGEEGVEGDPGFGEGVDFGMGAEDLL